MCWALVAIHGKRSLKRLDATRQRVMKFQAFPSSHARRLQETVETFWGTKGIVSKLAWGCLRLAKGKVTNTSRSSYFLKRMFSPLPNYWWHERSCGESPRNGETGVQWWVQIIQMIKTNTTTSIILIRLVSQLLYDLLSFTKHAMWIKWSNISLLWSAVNEWLIH